MVAGTRLKWEDPPGGQGGRRDGVAHKDISAKLRRQPGKWAHVLTYGSARTSGSVAGIIRTGRTSAWQPARHYEATANKVDGEYRVYARYVGEPSE